MISDSEHRVDRKSPPRRAVNARTNKHWSDSQKMEAVTTYVMLGSKALTAKTLGIPVDTIKTWTRMDWWKERVDDIRSEEKIVLGKRLNSLVDASLALAQDRLENGDWIYDQKAGELRRKPVSLRDAGKIAIDVINTKQKMETTEHHTVANEQIEEKLNKLAQAFMNLSKGITNNQSVEDIEYKEPEVIDDAVYEEREEGLQEGERPLQLETGTTEESQ